MRVLHVGSFIHEYLLIQGKSFFGTLFFHADQTGFLNVFFALADNFYNGSK